MNAEDENNTAMASEESAEFYVQVTYILSKKARAFWLPLIRLTVMKKITELKI